MDKQYCGEFVHEICDDHMAELPFTNCGTQLQNLPVEVLMEIFSSLDLMDFCSLAETCKLFRDITLSLIGKRAWVYGQYEYVFESPKFFYTSYERNDIERIFKNFGSLLSRVSIGSDEYREHRDENFLLNLVKSHCGERLKYLDIYNREISATIAEDLKPIFRRLQTFKLFCVSIEGNSSPFRDLDSLVELQMDDVENCSSILENTFPKLEKFSCEIIPRSDDQNDPRLEKLSTFITRHTILKSLAIYLTCDRCDESDWMIILQAIDNNCTELQEFTLGFIDDQDCLPASLTLLQSLNSLRTVSLRSVSFEELKAFASLTQLRTLHLEDCLLPTDVDEFAYLAQLTEVSMTDCETTDEYRVTHIIRHLVNLVKLKLLRLIIFDDMEFALNQATLREIVNIYEGRPSILELECRCDSTVRKRLRGQKVELIRVN